MNEQAPAYTIGTPQDSMAYNDQGRAVPHKRVPIRLVDGTQTYVEVPYEPGWPEVAQERVQQLWDEYQRLMNVQGPPVQAPPQRRQNRL